MKNYKTLQVYVSVNDLLGGTIDYVSESQCAYVRAADKFRNNTYFHKFENLLLIKSSRPSISFISFGKILFVLIPPVIK